MAISKVMVESYKKLVLTSFILYGKMRSTPIKASPSTNVFLRSVRSSTQAYMDISDCKCASEMMELKTKHQIQFADDQNLGLFKQYVVSLYKRNIQKLTKTFLTLSLADIKGNVKADRVTKTEKYLREMIEDGQICANIDHKQGKVHFLDNTTDNAGDRALQKLSVLISKCVGINARFQELDDAVKVSFPYFPQQGCQFGGLRASSLGVSGRTMNWVCPIREKPPAFETQMI